MDDHVVREALVCSFGCRSQTNNAQLQWHHKKCFEQWHHTNFSRQIIWNTFLEPIGFAHPPVEHIAIQFRFTTDVLTAAPS